MVHRVLPTDEAEDLLALVRQIADEQLLPQVDEAEAAKRFPREVFAMLGQAGLLSLPYPEELGGGGQPYEVYLQVIEELARGWMSVAVGVSVHSLTAFPMATFGTAEQQERWLTGMLSGDQLGAYCLSEPQAGSDVAAIRTRAEKVGTGSAADYLITGGKAWISHAGHADYYTLFARTSDEGGRGLACFHVPAGTQGLSFPEPERKMGLHSDTVGEVLLDGVRLPAEHRIGEEGKGMPIALAALDSGRLGIAAAATGLAQRALEVASAYATEREQFGRPIADNQGLAFLLADMAAAVGAARATYLHAARLKDAGLPNTQETAVAKLVATDAAMKVTTDAVQVLGGYGYTTDFPVERFMREAKVTQIFEGTNQIQRLVIAREVLAAHR
ncbi:acyl-CoA dehydrogenase family protein [Ornithinimicrobium avium]|uniref:Acyl-CoA dehydrogenase n=1 Tax=Ornithinimicrobium avium TaxID=2283195 RepID=A0A345NQW5_9MICO|nr:acyl-CoA dehydrogenase family protein [Ornithinimicrobium avium]AXH97423.1 acyl-CoA dehydrogenase [Ornithinimicrobium avium]